MSEETTAYTLLTLADGETTLKTIANWSFETRMYQGVQRSVLELHILETDTTYEALRNIMTNTELLDEITISDFATSEFLSAYFHYTIPVSITLKEIDGTKRFVFEVAQMTQMELMQADQQQQILDTQIALAEMIEGV